MIRKLLLTISTTALLAASGADGRAQIPSGLPPQRVVQETPRGPVDPAGVTFTLTRSPAAGAILLLYGNRPLVPGYDYALRGDTITMAWLPIPGTRLRASYDRGDGRP